MDRYDFLQLIKDKDKEIAVDIEFVRVRNMPDYVLMFDNADVINSCGYDIVLNGSFNRKTRALKFNFVLRGIGPICRVEVNGCIHGTVGRTHKHDVRDKSDPRKDLPFAYARPDLENLGPREVWEDLCHKANILHRGKFVDPLDGAQ